jgi:selenium-binding protein 1
VKSGSPTFSQIVHSVTMPYKGDEFHHFGWNACSSALSPLTGHAFLERRYLIIPGLRSSRIYIVDTKPDPTSAKIHKIIEPDEVFKKTGYSRPHTVHCGPEGIYISTLGGGGKDGTDGPPGVFIMDCETFDILGRWEIDRGPQNMHYDFWWNLPRDYMVTSEWGLPPQFENGIVPEDLLSNKYGHRIHFWDLRARRNVQSIDLGANHQMGLEVRPAHDPVREYGFLGVVVDTTNLEGSIWTWWREGGKFHVEKTATIPPESASKDQLPPLLQGFGAVPPLVTDIDLSMDDRFLYVACWGTGEMRYGRYRSAICWRCSWCSFPSRCSSPSSNGSGRSRSAPASWSSGSVSSGSPTGAIRGCWRGYDQRNWACGPSPWRSRMARD